MADTSKTTKQRRRLAGGGRKPLSSELENRVLEWIHNMRARRQR